MNKNNFLVFIFLLSSFSSFATFAEVRLISVSGIAEKSFKPNQITFNLVIWAKANKAKDAQKNQALIADKIKKTFTHFAIDPKDIMTTNYDLNPDYSYDQKTGQSNISGFHANESVTLTLKKIEDAGKFIDDLSSPQEKSSGVSINGILWDVDNREAILNELLQDAVKAARTKADLLALASGVKIKHVFHISPFMSSVNPTNSPVMLMDNMKMGGLALPESSPQTNIQSGQVKIFNAVTIDYEIE